MAAEKVYTVEVIGRDYCGRGACGLHFAHGKAETSDPVAVAWYQNHDGYKVTAKRGTAAKED